MKDIKEILDKPKILVLSYGNYISLDDYVKLKDYITNLQKKYDKALVKESHKIMELSKNYDRIYNENCKLREKHNITDISLLDENTNLKQELKEANKLLSIANDEVVSYTNACIDLQQKIEKLENDKRGMLVQLYKSNDEKDNYKSKCEKAIEYIKTKEVDFVDVHYQQQDDYFNGLLNILQGSDK